MREVIDAHATAKVFSDDVEDYAVAQIRMICDDVAAEDSLTHVPTGIVASSTEERSQYQNRRRALARLNAALAKHDADARDGQRREAWSKHAQIVRGNPVRTYEGMDFKRKDCT